jgi:hypothetical protein
MEIWTAVRELVAADGATLPLVLVGMALGLIGMALYAVILVLRKKSS